MSNHRIFPEPQKSDEDDRIGTKKTFEHVATKVFTVDKAEIDRREAEWKRQRKS